MDKEQIRHEAKEDEYRGSCYYDPEDIILIYCKACGEEFSIIAGEADCPICDEPSEICS